MHRYIYLRALSDHVTPGDRGSLHSRDDFWSLRAQVYSICALLSLRGALVPKFVSDSISDFLPLSLSLSLLPLCMRFVRTPFFRQGVEYKGSSRAFRFILFRIHPSLLFFSSSVPAFLFPLGVEERFAGTFLSRRLVWSERVIFGKMGYIDVLDRDRTGAKVVQRRRYVFIALVCELARLFWVV